jgi:hypothetical protein
MFGRLFGIFCQTSATSLLSAQQYTVLATPRKCNARDASRDRSSNPRDAIGSDIDVLLCQNAGQMANMSL